MKRIFSAEFVKKYQILLSGLVLIVCMAVSYYVSETTYRKFTTEITEISMGQKVFIQTMSDSSYTAWISVILSCLLIGMVFSDRTINRMILAGISRKEIFTYKALEYYVITLTISFSCSVFGWIAFSGKWLSGLSLTDWLCLLGDVGIKLMLDTALISISFMIVFLFRDLIRSLTASMVATGIFIEIFKDFYFGGETVTLLERVVNLYPAFQLQNIMGTETTTEELVIAIVSAVIIIGSTVTIAYLSFRRAELK